jgi:hypothetical protein
VGDRLQEDVMAQDKEKKVKKIKELFVQDLARIQGGTGPVVRTDGCPQITTLACGEESPKCGC